LGPCNVRGCGRQKYDLTIEFAQVTEDDVMDSINAQWEAPTIDTDKHTNNNNK